MTTTSKANIVRPMLHPLYFCPKRAMISTPPVVPPAQNTIPRPIPTVTPAYKEARRVSCMGWRKGAKRDKDKETARVPTMV